VCDETRSLLNDQHEIINRSQQRLDGLKKATEADTSRPIEGMRINRGSGAHLVEPTRLERAVEANVADIRLIYAKDWRGASMLRFDRAEVLTCTRP
jgi:hypothetical protein